MARAAYPPAVFIMGPTASGKTDLAIALQDALPGDLISVDSAMVYRGLDIGTAKPDAECLRRAPHQLIDIREPDAPYSAADFRRDALEAMDASTAAGRIPILVGGTMMYFRALQQGLAEMPQADTKVRAKLEEEWQNSGPDVLHQQLNDVDPDAAARIHPNNRQRVIRALEVYRLTGRPISAFWTGSEDGATAWEQEPDDPGALLPYTVIPLALCPASRDELHRRIRQRFEQMLAEGLIDEVSALKQRAGMHDRLPSVRSVGYRQLWGYLDGEYDYDTMMAKGLAATRQLAKRQLTWLRRWPGVCWLDTDAPDLLQQALKIIGERVTLESK